MRNPKAPDEQCQLVEDHPHERERGNRAYARATRGRPYRSSSASGATHGCPGLGGSTLGGRAAELPTVWPVDQLRHRSTPAPLRLRFTIADAMRLITRVRTNRTNPHISRSSRPSLPPEPKLMAIRLAMVRTAVLEDVRRDDERSTEDDRNCDRLFECAAHPEHHGSDHPAAAERKNDRPDHLPPAGAERQRSLALSWRGEREDLATHRGDDRDDHQPDDQSRDEERSIRRRVRRL